MKLRQKITDHWLSAVASVIIATSAATYYAMNVLYIEPRNETIDLLRVKLAEVESSLKNSSEVVNNYKIDSVTREKYNEVSGAKDAIATEFAATLNEKNELVKEKNKTSADLNDLKGKVADLSKANTLLLQANKKHEQYVAKTDVEEQRVKREALLNEKILLLKKEKHQISDRMEKMLISLKVGSSEAAASLEECNMCKISQSDDCEYLVDICMSAAKDAEEINQETKEFLWLQNKYDELKNEIQLLQTKL
jgi:hypothetical protein